MLRFKYVNKNDENKKFFDLNIFRKLRIDKDTDVDDMLLTERGIVDMTCSVSTTKDNTMVRQSSVGNRSYAFKKRRATTHQIAEKQVEKFMFKQNDSFKSKWDILIMLSAIFNCFTIPFKVAFEP